MSKLSEFSKIHFIHTIHIIFLLFFYIFIYINLHKFYFLFLFFLFCRNTDHPAQFSKMRLLTICHQCFQTLCLRQHLHILFFVFLQLILTKGKVTYMYSCWWLFWFTRLRLSSHFWHRIKVSKRLSRGAFTIANFATFKIATFWSYHLHLREKSRSFSFTKLHDFLVGSAHVRSQATVHAFMHAVCMRAEDIDTRFKERA